MRRFQLLAAVLFLLFSSIYTACKKTDAVASKEKTLLDRFFSPPDNAPVEVKAIALAIKKQNDQYNYRSFIIKRAGYPRWDKARIANFDKGNLTGRGAGEADGEVIYIPFVKDSDNYVNALLTVKINASDTVYRMLYDYKYKAYGYDTADHSKWNARDVFTLFTSFDYSVFGHTRFWIRDTNLFKAANDSSYVIATRTGGTNHRSSARTSLYAVQECATWELCTYPGSGPSSGDGGTETSPSGGYLVARTSSDCSYFDICTTYYYDEGGGIDTGTGDGTGGSGGTGWYSGGSTPCPSGGAVERTFFMAPTDCDPGWVPVNTDNNLNPCDAFISLLQNDQVFATKFSSLNAPSVMGLGHEKGFFIKDRTTNEYLELDGSASAPIIQLNFSIPMEGFLHSHYTGLNSIFSADDIVLMSQTYLRGLAKDSMNLYFGVTSSYGDPYLIKVTNAIQFRTFAQKVIDLESKKNAFTYNYNRKLNTDDISKNEKEFLKMINDMKAGTAVSLYRGNSGCTHWTLLSLDGFGDIVTKDCF